MTQHGIIIRMSVHDIRTIGRVTQGVRLISLTENDIVVDVERVPAGENDDIEEQFEEDETDSNDA